ncbi:MAG: lipoyl(octanoyl) transferase LipB [Magnetococcales bacterium]|nr:lipoyl(octanoyl) transferase LipB [Magnetococcales bacterium]
MIPETTFLLRRHRRQSYEVALAEQRRQVEAIVAGLALPTLILTEHDAVYTVGRSGEREREVLAPGTIPVVATDRGGRTTYHGPGQLVAYVLTPLFPRLVGVKAHVERLEACVIDTLSRLGLEGERDARAPGVWVRGAKIAALGVRVFRGVSYHGLALNRDPDLSAYGGIVPCGLHRPVTSLAALGLSLSRETLETLFLESFGRIFAVGSWQVEREEDTHHGSPHHAVSGG